MKPYLFTLTISPVQSFIAQARKSQDLFAGSEILSQLMGKVLETFTKEERIFPQNKEAVSNKIVVKLENKTANDIKKIGETLKVKINNDFINAVFKETKCYDNSLQNFFQVFWVAVELKNCIDEESKNKEYKDSYKNLERNLGAVKNLRTFKQEPPQESGQKCSLCGERNGLFYNSDERPKYIVKKATRVIDAQIKENETVCLICYTKRKCEINNVDKEKFPSLADIVVLNKKDKPQDAEAFLDANASEKKHYALLHFDVDNLGKTLSGLPEEGQKYLSTALGDFALKAKTIVDTQNNNIENTRCTIYAGGDDFLGFVNLAYLFEVMQEIKDAFREAKASLPYELTFSTSIVIAPYKTPLHKVLDYSRELLQESKDHFDDKNAVGVMVMSSNTIISKTICRYEDIGLLKELKTAEIGKNIHFKLAQIFDYLESQKNLNREEYSSLIVMLEYEIKRLLKREAEEFNQKLYERLVLFLHKQVSGLTTNDKIKINFDNLIGYLKTLEQLRKVM